MTEKTFSTPRKLIAVLGLTCALALTVLATTPRLADAAAIKQDCTYFSDASHSKVVGQRGVDCCGNSIDWGVTSPYFTCEPVPVCVWCPPVS
jgi:hypothetical protein